MTERWREVGDRVFVRRHASLDLNVGLVVGDTGCLVIDTRCSAVEGRELAAAVRSITPTPWSVVTTHAHFDHCFGTSAFLPADVWAQERCAAAIRDVGEQERSRVAGGYEEEGRADLARQIRASPLPVPQRLVDQHAALDVGGRRVELRHLGRGHTDHDLVVIVPDGGVVFAGDLVEEGGPPQFEDAFPLEWPATLDVLLATTTATVVVPGHGDVVGRDVVATQREVLSRLVRRGADGHAAGAGAGDVASTLPELGEFAVQAVQRTYWQLERDEAPR